MLLLVLVSLLGGSNALEITPAAFMKLNDSNTDDSTGNPVFGNGAATAAAYDSDTKFLYVIGTQGDVMNIISLTDPDNPQHIKKITYNGVTDGFPDAIALCTFGIRRYLAVGFEKLGTTSAAHVKIYIPLETEHDELELAYDQATLDGYDPTAMVWSNDCGNLVVVQQGRVHLLNNAFDDPEPYIDILVPGAGGTISRTQVSINETAVAEAGGRHVLRQCEGETGKTSTRKQDLEPRAIVKDNDANAVYIAFPKNNLLGRLNLSDSNPDYIVEYINVGAKDWHPSQIDASDNDVKARGNFPIFTFYQPADLALFHQNGEIYVASADTGEFMSLSGAEDDCQFEESASGVDWIQTELFGAGMSAEDRTALNASMRIGDELGRMRFTKIRDPSDYYHVPTQGFNQVTGYGGRGMSILKVSTLERVYDSNDAFEGVFFEQDVPDEVEAIFNADVGSASSAPSSRMDKTSATTGPTPRAIVAGEIGGTLVLVVANGHVGGLYFYTVDRSGDDPLPSLQAFIRRGNTGQSWSTSYAQEGDSVGEPETKDIQWIDLGLDNEAMIAVMGNRAGVVSFYRLTLSAE